MSSLSNRWLQLPMGPVREAIREIYQYVSGLNTSIEKGPKGDKGDKGEPGSPGTDGSVASFDSLVISGTYPDFGLTFDEAGDVITV